MINWTEVIISLCSLVITGILIPLITTRWKEAKAEMSKSTQETIEYWTEIGVRYAKQWLSTESGEKKKEAVLDFVSDKLKELKISVSPSELEKVIEAVYEKVKKE